MVFLKTTTTVILPLLPCGLVYLCSPLAYRAPCVTLMAIIMWRRCFSLRKSRTLPGGQRTVGDHFLHDEEVKGLIFDCDGTLLDTMPLFFHSWEEVCPEFGLSITLDDFYSYAGMPLPEIVRRMHREQLSGEASQDFVDQFLLAKQKSHLRHESSRGHPDPIHCVVNLAYDAVSKGLPICIATSGLRSHVESHLKAARLDGLFNEKLGNIVCAADVPHGLFSHT